jgi:hypothetical protein
LFDEFDHLGAYIEKNRIDEDISDHFRQGKADLLVLDGMSKIIDRSFESEGWEDNPFPTQRIPKELVNLLAALDATRAKGWLFAESHIRNYGDQARNELAALLSDLRIKISQHPERYFALASDEQPLFVWMQSSEHPVDWQKINDKASATALVADSLEVVGVFVEVSDEGTFGKAQYFRVVAPSNRTSDNAHIYDDANRMRRRTANTYLPRA